jgi:hypothetical protein
VSLLRREPLEVDVDLQLDVLAHRADAVRRLVLAQEVLLATLEKPGTDDMIIIFSLKFGKKVTFCTENMYC